jgi:hypothetical protein
MFSSFHRKEAIPTSFAGSLSLAFIRSSRIKGGVKSTRLWLATHAGTNIQCFKAFSEREAVEVAKVENLG